MRNLQTRDVFSFLRILKTMGIKEEFEQMALLVEGNKNINPRDVGMKLILNVIANASNTEAECKVYEFLGDVLEIENVEILDALDLFDEIGKYIDFIDKERWINFIRAVSSSIAKVS